MTCERARDLLSDYLEGALERSLAGKVDGHLAGCAHCRDDVGELRAIWQDLDSLPVVHPPADLCERVIAAVHRERMALPPPPQSFFAWLRGLSPARVALGTSLATLVIAGALLAPRWVGTPLGAVPGFGAGAPSAAARKPPEVSVTVAYGAASPDGQRVNVTLNAERTVPDVKVSFRRGDSGLFIDGGEGVLNASSPESISVLLQSASAPVEPLFVKLASSQAGLDRTYYCAVPVRPRAVPGLVSATFVDTPLDRAVLQMAERLGQPVVMDGTLASTPVSALVTHAPVDQAWLKILGPLNLRAVRDPGTGTYRLLVRD